MLLIVFTCLLLVLTAESASPIKILPKVLSREADGKCPSEEILQSARRNITSSLLAAIKNVPEECGNGWWNEVVRLNMSDSSQQCPSSWTLSSSFRACSRSNGSVAGCSTAKFSVNTSYTKVCGRVTGSANGSTDGFGNFSAARDAVNYLDGVSITRSSPAQHIWSFAVNYRTYNCPCSNYAGGPSTPDFVGNNYFCDLSRNNANGFVWDGEECTQALPCCNFNTPPWFRADLMSSSSDDIEVRICADQDNHDEDIAVQLLELYVQ